MFSKHRTTVHNFYRHRLRKSFEDQTPVLFAWIVFVKKHWNYQLGVYIGGSPRLASLRPRSPQRSREDVARTGRATRRSQPRAWPQPHENLSSSQFLSHSGFRKGVLRKKNIFSWKQCGKFSNQGRRGVVSSGWTWRQLYFISSYQGETAAVLGMELLQNWLPSRCFRIIRLISTHLPNSWHICPR